MVALLKAPPVKRSYSPRPELPSSPTRELGTVHAGGGDVAAERYTASMTREKMIRLFSSGMRRAFLNASTGWDT
jgi:hypothetical protein